MDKKIKIYTTSGCHYCQQAKEFLTEKGVEFESCDVGADKAAFQEMKKITGGARSVPVISIGDRVIVGFERAEIEQALK